MVIRRSKDILTRYRFFQCSGFDGNDYGGFQEYVLVPAEIASKIPSNLSYNEAASIPLVLTSAAIGLFAPVPNGAGLNPTYDLNVKYTGQSAFVTGGGTSVGNFGESQRKYECSLFILTSCIKAIQLLKFLDFEKIITNCSADHFDYLKSLGATDVIDRNEVGDSDLPRVVGEILGGSGRKVDVAFDAVGETTSQAAALACLKDGVHLPSVWILEHTPEGRSAAHIWGSTWPDFNREFGRVHWAKIGGMFEAGFLKVRRMILGHQLERYSFFVAM